MWRDGKKTCRVGILFLVEISENRKNNPLKEDCQKEFRHYSKYVIIESTIIPI